MGTPREIRWSWKSRDNMIRTGYLAVDGRVTLAELNDLMLRVAPGVSPAAIEINWATIVWDREATAEEIAQRREAERRHDERHEAWERETYARLRDKYGEH